MAKKSPKRPRPAAEKPKAPPPNAQKPLPPDAVKKAIKFYRDSREIEHNIYRSIYG